MINDELVLKILEASAEEAEKSIKKNKVLSIDNAMPIILKGLYNHVAHLEQNMITREEFKSEIGGIKWIMGIGLTLILAMFGFLYFTIKF